MTRARAFVVVGAMGLVVQLACLAVLTSRAAWHWLPATVAAVEVAVVHNFVWHARWTWRDRTNTGARAAMWRFAKFNGSNGLTSLAGNTALMTLFAGVLGVPALAANVLAVVVLAIVNFAVADRWVFSSGSPRRRRAPALRAEWDGPRSARARNTRPRCGW
jgi:putative flippase GtrA